MILRPTLATLQHHTNSSVKQYRQIATISKAIYYPYLAQYMTIYVTVKPVKAALLTHN